MAMTDSNSRLQAYSEFSLINTLTGTLARHPDQLNRTHEADAELLPLGDGSVLASTVDTLIEEYALGFLRDPRVLGWTVVAQSLSDLAAVGADPLGVLLAVSLPRGNDHAWNQAFFQGVQDCVAHHGTFCLGGDTNFSDQPTFTCTALGRIPAGRKPLTRVGLRPGDRL
jgi:thiamine-monophosphate kinase